MSDGTSLLPREHGAYAELAFPLLTGLGLSMPSLSAISLALAAVAFFLAHEPVAILLGGRGKRLRERFGQVAPRRAAALLGAGALLGALGTAGAGARAWPSVLLPAAFGAILVPVVISGRQKTVPGELVVVTVVSSLVLPLAAASGADPARAVWAGAAWWLSFALGTLEVHAIKARHKRDARDGWTRWASPFASGLVLLLALSLSTGVIRPENVSTWGPEPPTAHGGISSSSLVGSGTWPNPYPVSAAAALIPPGLAVFLLSLLRVHPRHLKRVGWTLVGANGLTLLILLWG